MILSGNIHTIQNKKKMYAGEISGLFLFFDHQTKKKVLKSIFVNSGYLKSKQEFSIFPLLLFIKKKKTFEVRGGSI